MGQEVELNSQPTPGHRHQTAVSKPEARRGESPTDEATMNSARPRSGSIVDLTLDESSLEEWELPDLTFPETKVMPQSPVDGHKLPLSRSGEARNFSTKKTVAVSQQELGITMTRTGAVDGKMKPGCGPKTTGTWQCTGIRDSVIGDSLRERQYYQAIQDSAQYPQARLPSGERQYSQVSQDSAQARLPSGERKYSQYPKARLPSGERQYYQVSQDSAQYPQARLPSGERQYYQVIQDSAQYPQARLPSGERQYYQVIQDSAQYPQARLPSGERQYSQVSQDSAQYPQARLPSGERQYSQVSQDSAQYPQARLPSGKRQYYQVIQDSAQYPQAGLSSGERQYYQVIQDSAQYPQARLPSGERQYSQVLQDSAPHSQLPQDGRRPAGESQHSQGATTTAAGKDALRDKSDTRQLAKAAAHRGFVDSQSEDWLPDLDDSDCADLMQPCSGTLTPTTPTPPTTRKTSNFSPTRTGVKRPRPSSPENIGHPVPKRCRKASGERTPLSSLVEGNQGEDSDPDSSLRCLELLSDKELQAIVKDFRSDLVSISQGSLHSHRHQLYVTGGHARRQLDHLSNLQYFASGQEDVVMDILMTLFTPLQLDKLDYLLRVLLPEALHRIYRRVTGTSLP
ncbi:hypothetical protein ACOMHN_024888 [Nucella lapillus]